MRRGGNTGLIELEPIQVATPAVATKTQARAKKSAAEVAFGAHLDLFLAKETPTGALGLTLRGKPEGLDLASMTLHGEHGTTYVHNGYEVVVFLKAGLIAYDNPRPGIASLVQRGDVLFRRAHG